LNGEVRERHEFKKTVPKKGVHFAGENTMPRDRPIVEESNRKLKKKKKENTTGESWGLQLGVR